MSLSGQEKLIFDLQEFIESNFNIQDESLNYEDLYERLFLLYEDPINLNDVSEEDLLALHILSTNQVSALLDYILTRGKLISIYELLYINGFDNGTINKLLPFVSVSQVKTDGRSLFKRIIQEKNNYFILRYERTLEEKRGYQSATDDGYLGSPDKLYFRYRVSNPKDFSVGFTMEKDAGETLFGNNAFKKRGIDFWSAHLLFENKRKWKKIVLGDYQLQLGQGLLYGAGFGIGKGSETINNLEKAHMGIRPYTSVIEGGFLRGVAATYGISNKVNTTIFTSHLKQDANIQTGDLEDFQTYFSSIQLSGFHRTHSELARKGAIDETLAGIDISYKPNHLNRVGFIASINRFSVPILRANKPYNQFEFSGSTNSNLGLYGKTSWHQFNFFGETSISRSGGLGMVMGFTSSLSARIDFAMIFRNFQKNFHSLRSSAFSEGSRNINESGIYWGIKYILNKRFNLSAYFDTFRFPWLRFRTNAPSEGKDYLIRLNYSPNRKVNTYFQLRSKVKDQNFRDLETNHINVLPGKKKQYLFNLDVEINHSLILKSRVQHSKYQIATNKTSGYAFSQDATYKHNNLTISGRLALFDTEGAENRQYMYERDVLYAFSIPAYSGRGIRNYVLISYRLNTNIDLWARLSRTTFYDRSEIGTGLETIDGNKKTDIKFQIRYKIR